MLGRSSVLSSICCSCACHMQKAMVVQIVRFLYISPNFKNEWRISSIQQHFNHFKEADPEFASVLLLARLIFVSYETGAKLL